MKDVQYVKFILATRFDAAWILSGAIIFIVIIFFL